MVILHSAYTTIEKMVALVSPSKFRDWSVVIPEALPAALPRWMENPVTTPGEVDVEFIDYVVARAVVQTKADPNRIFVMGFSSGAFMAMRLLHENVGARFRGAACVAGALLNVYTRPEWSAYPTPMLLINGTADMNTPYNGQYGLLSVPETLLYWAKKQDAQTIPVITTLPNTSADGTTVTKTSYAGTVELYAINNGGHYWPGSAKNLVTGPGEVCMDIDATMVIRDFFSRL